MYCLSDAQRSVWGQKAAHYLPASIAPTASLNWSMATGSSRMS
jgi:hypothetical protein